MPRNQVDPVVEQIRAVLDPGLRTLNRDALMVGRALRKLPARGAEQEAVRVLTRARTHALDLRAQLGALQLDHPAARALSYGLALLVSALSTFELSLTTIGRTQSRYAGRATTLFRRAGAALLDADRALGCPYKCLEQRP